MWLMAYHVSCCSAAQYDVFILSSFEYIDWWLHWGLCDAVCEVLSHPALSVLLKEFTLPVWPTWELCEVKTHEDFCTIVQLVARAAVGTGIIVQGLNKGAFCMPDQNVRLRPWESDQALSPLNNPVFGVISMTEQAWNHQWVWRNGLVKIPTSAAQQRKGGKTTG